jgi:hypothetical protein
LQSRFSQWRMTTPVQQIAPRKITGARNVTRKLAFSNETLNCHSPFVARAFSVSPKCNRMHLRGEMDFGFARPGVTEKKKPGEAGL